MPTLLIGSLIRNIIHFLDPRFSGMHPLMQSVPGGAEKINDADINSLTNAAMQAISGEKVCAFLIQVLSKLLS